MPSLGRTSEATQWQQTLISYHSPWRTGQHRCRPEVASALLSGLTAGSIQVERGERSAGSEALADCVDCVASRGHGGPDCTHVVELTSKGLLVRTSDFGAVRAPT